MALPAIGTAGGFGGRRTDKELYYAFTSFTYPTTIHKYDTATNQRTIFKAPKVDVKPEERMTLSVRNIDGVRMLASNRVSARDVMDTRRVVLTRAALEKLQEALG